MTTIWNSSHRFDRKAAEWDENPRRTALAECVAKAIIETAGPVATMRAMEFGCGTGLLTLALAPHLGRFTAIDTSEEMLGVLNKKIETLGIRTVATRCADLLQVEEGMLWTEKPDFICSSMTLHHIADTQALLDRLNGLLRKGGTIAIADLDLEDGFFHDDETEEVHPGFERSLLQAMLEKAGFERVSFITACEISKTNRAGEVKTYPIFLATAVKP
jgi:2-polyprenyl-3-methyl-5-hydroxy-6-metoxy-1,4-benzoquinol methylase